MSAAGSGEQFCRVGEIELCFETFGDPVDPVMLLVMGLGTQMIAWPEEFCAALADRGFRVIRFDNRDCGRSTHLRDAPVPSRASILRRRPRPLAYSLADMASDAIELLNALDVERAHLVGASMGGMIAQLVACTVPARVRSLTSIMSNTGDRRNGRPKARMWRHLLGGLATDRDSYEKRLLRVGAAIASPAYPPDVATQRELARASFDRGLDEAGTMRQLAAAIADGDRTERLGSLHVPTLVVHGTRDPLIRPSGGRATARAVPGARLLLIDGMGHDLPRELWPRIVTAVTDHARSAEPVRALA